MKVYPQTTERTRSFSLWRVNFTTRQRTKWYLPWVNWFGSTPWRAQVILWTTEGSSSPDFLDHVYCTKVPAAWMYVHLHFGYEDVRARYENVASRDKMQQVFIFQCKCVFHWKWGKKSTKCQNKIEYRVYAGSRALRDKPKQAILTAKLSLLLLVWEHVDRTPRQ